MPMLEASTARVLMAVLALLAAGCTTQPPPTTPPPAELPYRLALTAGDTAAGPGSQVTFTWELTRGEGAGATHSELHYGPASVSDPLAGVYPNTAPGTAGEANRWTGTAAMPASGALHARAHVTIGGQQVWSDEVRVAPVTGVQFTNVDIPTTVEAGVPFTIKYRAEGAGSTGHIGAHFSDQSSAAMPAGFAAGTWPGQRASEHLGAPTAVSLPADVSVKATIPSNGTWYLRPHALLGTAHHWGSEVTITATHPGTPNIVLLDAPASAVAGIPVNLTYHLNAQPGTSNHVGAHFSMNSSASMAPGFAATSWPGQRASPHQGTAQAVDIPGRFTVPLTFPLPGTWYVRGHALVGGATVWSSEFAVQVAGPAEARVILLNPSPTHEVQLNPLVGARVPLYELEWAVLLPGNSTGNTSHTDAHHGPASVANPSETGGATSSYPQSTADQHGALPGLFRGNFSITATQNQPYYVRAMAIVMDENQQAREVWSDEFAITVTVRT